MMTENSLSCFRCCNWCLVKLLRKASLKKGAGHCAEDWVLQLQIPFCWQIRGLCQREGAIPCTTAANSPRAHLSVPPGRCTLTGLTAYYSKVDASALFCCDTIQEFKGSKARTVEINSFHSSEKQPEQQLMKTSAIRKQQSSMPTGKIQNEAQRACKLSDKWNSPKGKRIKGNEVTQRLILDPTDVRRVFWFWAIRQNTFDTDSTRKLRYDAQKRNYV